MLAISSKTFQIVGKSPIFVVFTALHTPVLGRIQAFERPELLEANQSSPVGSLGRTKARGHPPARGPDAALGHLPKPRLPLGVGGCWRGLGAPPPPVRRYGARPSRPLLPAEAVSGRSSVTEAAGGPREPRSKLPGRAAAAVPPLASPSGQALTRHSGHAGVRERTRRVHPNTRAVRAGHFPRPRQEARSAAAARGGSPPAPPGLAHRGGRALPRPREVGGRRPRHGPEDRLPGEACAPGRADPVRGRVSGAARRRRRPRGGRGRKGGAPGGRGAV